MNIIVNIKKAKKDLEMKFNKLATILLTGALSACLIVGAAGCSSNDSAVKDLENKLSGYESKLDEMGKLLEEMNNSLKPTEITAPVEYSEECYEKVKYIDSVLRDRDCINGESFELAQKWIAWNLIQAGYGEDDIKFQDVTFTRRGTEYTSPNIVIKKQGKSEKQIIVGAHYDGTGTGDNGSGVALALTTAEKIADMELEYTITFVFFTAEEYGCYGSTAYANAMTETEIANTLYMINLDSLVCGDYAYIYGGVQDNANKTVTQTQAYDNAMEVAKSLGLSLKSNPWTWENPAPGYDEPDYASPSTGDWSDHKGFKKKGIPYIYFEATNWEIPGPYAEYDGYGETYLIGMLMNTENDYLEYIEKYFPGRIQQHLKTFSTLLYALVTQTEVNF